MDTGSSPRETDRIIAELAREQHGVVARRQLLEAGLSTTEIGGRLRKGRLHRLHRGVYLVGHAVPPAHAREAAALLACGADAVLSHRSAAAIWGLLAYPAAAHVCVTMPPARRLARPRIRLHRSSLDHRDVRYRHGLPLTSPPRTILDLAGELGTEDLEWLVAEANYRRLASAPELRDQLERNPGKRGNATLRIVLDLPGGPARTRSPAERQMVRLLREAGLTGYELNQRIHGFEVDVLWRELSLAVEIDGYDAHSGRLAFERDRLKVATLKAQGLDVMPITPRQLRDDPDGVLARLDRALELAGYRQSG
ncbi:MAG: type IV toxin-antitoxin system AbiEi family antitoxin domain-containing protein [Actinomycetota bacterium]